MQSNESLHAQYKREKRVVDGGGHQGPRLRNRLRKRIRRRMRNGTWNKRLKV